MQKKMMVLVCLPMLLTACGKTLDGTYKDASGMLELRLDGAYAHYLGMEKMTYRVDGKRLDFDNPQGDALRFSVKDDRTIISPIAGALIKQ